MSPIPLALRKQLAEDPWMKVCCVADENCSGRIQFHHTERYRGRQIQERAFIVGICEHHHFHSDLRKTVYIALLRATPDELARYPRTNWRQLYDHLDSLYGKESTPYLERLRSERNNDLA